MYIKRLKKGILKSVKKIRAFRPDGYRLSFYIKSLAGIDCGKGLFWEAGDEDEKGFNPGLLDFNDDNEGNIYSLMEEGVLSDCKTGSDLGIYNYQDDIKCEDLDFTKYTSSEFVHSISDIDNEQTYFKIEDDYLFRNCVLAEGNPLGGDDTKIVVTFKGYLEVTSDEFSIVRGFDEYGNVKKVYIYNDIIKKYHLRNGDELVGVCNDCDGRQVLKNLFTINQYSIYQWITDRRWFRDVSVERNIQSMKGKGEYTKAIINKFGLFEGDRVFVYLSTDTVKNQMLVKFMKELSEMFDKVLYISPQSRQWKLFDKDLGITKFCTDINDSFHIQTTITLLGANYARRLVELGKRVAIVVDDIDAIMALDKDFMPEMPISKTVLGATKACKNGSCTSFVIIPTRNNHKQYNLHDVFKSFETLGLVVENNEIDLFNSYRI